MEYRKFTLLSWSKIIFKQNVSAVLIGCRQFVLFVLGSTFVNFVWRTLSILNTDSHTTINGFNEILIYFQKLSYCNGIDYYVFIMLILSKISIADDKFSMF